MSQLQTVLDALILLGRAANLSHDATSVEAEAIALVKQMMLAEPVAWFEFNESLEAWFLAYGHNPKAKTRQLYEHPAPQAVPAVWVSLEDGMPSPHQMVLVARGPHITTGSYTPAFGWEWEEVDGEDEDSIATHWMPLPAAPKVAV